ncbi:MAG: hypothetical protein LBJ07_03630 [Actinomycetes bacterium]|jgi:hypothetical protein|nr:hypothetical protein [Actinomycetes bacterium]
MKHRIALFVVLLFLGIMVGCALPQRGTVSQYQETEKDVLFSGEEQVLLRQYGWFLPATATEYLPQFERLSLNGNEVLVWSKSQADGSVIHKLEVELKDDQLVRYHYKTYSFPVFRHVLSARQATELVEDFSQTYELGEQTLVFEHRKIDNDLYDEGLCESWVADEGKHTHVIMVNLTGGYVEEYYCER